MNSPDPDKQKTDDATPATPDTEGQVEPGAKNVTPEQMARFVTTIKNPVQQMGEHVLRALQHADTVAVLTTVVVGPGGEQHIVSAALDPEQTAQVNQLLQSAALTREDEEVCIGFHCLVKPKSKPDS